MKISEFAESVRELFSDFFQCEVKTEILFGGGEFKVLGFLEKDETWKTYNTRVDLYDISIKFTDDYSPKPKTDSIDFFLTGESKVLNYTLEETLVYIKENFTTVKSKTIYENL